MVLIIGYRTSLDQLRPGEICRLIFTGILPTTIEKVTEMH